MVLTLGHVSTFWVTTHGPEVIVPSAERVVVASNVVIKGLRPLPNGLFIAIALGCGEALTEANVFKVLVP